MLNVTVSLILRDCGIPAERKGYSRLRTAIILAVEDPSKLEAVTRILYPEVGAIHKESWVATERNMRTAIDNAFERGNAETLKRYVGNCANVHTGGVSVSEFIGGIVDFIYTYRLHTKEGTKCMFDDKLGIFRGWASPIVDGVLQAVVQNELGWLRLVNYDKILFLDYEEAK